MFIELNLSVLKFLPIGFEIVDIELPVFRCTLLELTRCFPESLFSVNPPFFS